MLTHGSHPGFGSYADRVPVAAAPKFLDVGSPVVAFDLDLTLVDTAPGIVATLQQVGEELGHPLDADDIRAGIGLPLNVMIAGRIPAALSDRAVARYRELYPTIGVPASSALPGAAEALAAVGVHGGRAFVVSAKIESAVSAVLEQAGLVTHGVTGGRYGAGKASAIRAYGAAIMVGDHPGDMAGARAAGAVAVAVTTGAHDAAALRAAGAEVVLDSLTAFRDWLDGWLLPLRLTALDEHLRRLGSVLVAFSGGADSAFLLAAAVQALGPDRVVAATAVSPSLPAAERSSAAAVAAEVGVRHVEVTTHEGERPGYRANGGDRCAFCKAELLDVLGPTARSLGLAAVVTGTNADDSRAGFRPGIRAATDRGALTPLRDAGLTKPQVRMASLDWGLSTWDKPAAACLASRVAYGVEVTPTRLARVERAEVALRNALAGWGARDLRVRDLGDGVARVEVDHSLVHRVSGSAEVTTAVLEAGFRAVEVDPRGFRSGALNELLVAPERWR